MLGKIIDFAFWLSDIFTSSRDPILAKYRMHWRRMVMFSMVALLGFVCSMLMAPTDAPVTGLQLVINNFTSFLYLGSLLITLSAAVGFLWASYQYWIIVDENG